MYRPPPSPVNQLNTNVFLREWAEFLSQYTTSTAELIIVEDINIHLDNTTHPHTTDMMHTLQSCGLQQHIYFYAPDRVLRSASQNLLVVPRGKHCQYGMRTFAMAAATLWNSLNVRDRSNRIRGSPSLESFKSNLKTLLFKEHFYPFSS